MLRIQIYVSHNNFRSVERKFSSPGLAVRPCDLITLRLHKVREKAKQFAFSVFVTLRRIELRFHP